MNTMFDTLLQLPLFQGLSQDDFTAIVGKVKLHFDKHEAGKTVIRSGDPCDRLAFLLKGELASKTVSDQGTYSFTEFVQAPYLIEPQSMFGLRTNYIATYAAHTDINTVCVSKPFVLNELFRYEIFRLNYLNIISSRAQNMYKRLWAETEDSTEKRIVHFILEHSERPTGRKVLKIKMEDLARFISDTRLNVSKALNKMQAKGLMELHRGEVVVFDAGLLDR